MCLICVSLDALEMKPYEAGLALVEMRSELTPAHVYEVEAKIKAVVLKSAPKNEDAEPIATALERTLNPDFYWGL